MTRTSLLERWCKIAAGQSLALGIWTAVAIVEAIALHWWVPLALAVASLLVTVYSAYNALEAARLARDMGERG